MKSLELAKQMLEEAGYKVTPPEDKFIPYKGQLVEAEKGSVYIFSHMCDSLFVSNAGIYFGSCRPLSNPLIKQFKPWSERGDYNGPANVLFDSNKIMFFATVAAVELMGNPIAFEPLEK